MYLPLFKDASTCFTSPTVLIFGNGLLIGWCHLENQKFLLNPTISMKCRLLTVDLYHSFINPVFIHSNM